MPCLVGEKTDQRRGKDSRFPGEIGLHSNLMVLFIHNGSTEALGNPSKFVLSEDGLDNHKQFNCNLASE